MGVGASFFIARDLDADGRVDVVSANPEASSVTVFWGKEGQQLFESARAITGFGLARAFAAVDFDLDGRLDLFLSLGQEVRVYLNPGVGGGSVPSLKIPTALRYTSLAVVD